MELRLLPFEAISSIFSFLDSNDLALLYATLDKRIQKQLRTPHAVRLLTLSPYHRIEPGIIIYFIRAITCVETLEAERFVRLGVDTLGLVSTLQPRHLILNPEFVSTDVHDVYEAYQEDPENESLKQLAANFCPKSGFPNLAHLVPSLRSLELVENYKIIGPAKDTDSNSTEGIPSIDLNALLPKTLQTLILRNHDYEYLLEAIQVLPRSLTRLTLGSDGDEKKSELPLVPIFERCADLEHLTILRVKTVKLLDEATTATSEGREMESLKFPRYLTSLHIESSYPPRELLMHASMRNSSLTELSMRFWPPPGFPFVTEYLSGVTLPSINLSQCLPISIRHLGLGGFTPMPFGFSKSKISNDFASLPSTLKSLILYNNSIEIEDLQLLVAHASSLESLEIQSDMIWRCLPPSPQYANANLAKLRDVRNAERFIVLQSDYLPLIPSALKILKAPLSLGALLSLSQDRPQLRISCPTPIMHSNLEDKDLVKTLGFDTTLYDKTFEEIRNAVCARLTPNVHFTHYHYEEEVENRGSHSLSSYNDSFQSWSTLNTELEMKAWSKRGPSAL